MTDEKKVHPRRRRKRKRARHRDKAKGTVTPLPVPPIDLRTAVARLHLLNHRVAL